MANEQLSAADRVTDRHKKNQEEENKRYSTELSKARLQDLNRRESEKKRKSNRKIDEGWFDFFPNILPHLPVGPAINPTSVQKGIASDVEKHGKPGWPLTQQWGDYWYNRLFPGAEEAHNIALAKLAQPTPLPEPPPEDNTDVILQIPDWMGGGQVGDQEDEDEP